MVKVVLIGCGYWGSNILRILFKNSKCMITAIVDPNIADVKISNKEIDNIPCFKTVSDFFHFNITVDAALIATPAHTHYDIAKQMIEKRINLFIEKPFCLSYSDALELFELSKINHVKMMVGHTFLYNSAVKYLKKNFYELGEPFYCCSQRLNLGKIRTDADVWWNLAPHDISILLHLFDNELPETINVQGGYFLQRNLHDVCFAHLKWKNNFIAHIHLSWLDYGKTRKMLFVGDKKMIVYDDMEKNNKIGIYDKGIDFFINDSKDKGFSNINYRNGKAYFPEISQSEPLENEIFHFVEYLEKDIPCITDSHHALLVMRILQAGHDSLHNNGKEINISEISHVESIR